MLNRVESKGYKNSIGPDPVEDDIAGRNYLALAYAIAGWEENHKIYYPTISKICATFKLYDASASTIKETKTNKKELRQLMTRVEMLRDKRPVMLEDLDTGELLEFKNGSQISVHFNKQSGYFAKYVRNHFIYKGKYIMYRKGDRPETVEKKRHHSQKNIVGTNVLTGEVKEFTSLKEAAEHIDKSVSYVSYLIRDKNQTKHGWKFEGKEQVGE